MKAVQVPAGTAVVFHRGHNCVRIPIRHGDYNGYEEQCGGGKPRLVLESSGFIKGVFATVPHWSIIHESMAGLGSNGLATLMRATVFGSSKDEEPIRSIPLDSRSSVLHTSDGLAVYAYLDTFILGAIRCLEERNTIPISSGWSNVDEFRQNWANCIARLEGTPQPATPEPLPFDADRIEV
jgi:hypothetical protein